MTTATQLREHIANIQARIDDLEAAHGTGVRSASVGEDIAFLVLNQRYAQDKLAELEAAQTNGETK
jgi:hypothetical protein